MAEAKGPHYSSPRNSDPDEDSAAELVQEVTGRGKRRKKIKRNVKMEITHSWEHSNLFCTEIWKSIRANQMERYFNSCVIMVRPNDQKVGMETARQYVLR